MNNEPNNQNPEPRVESAQMPVTDHQASPAGVVPVTPSGADPKVLEMLLPVHRSGWAIAAGYVALLNILIFTSLVTAPLAILFAILGLRAIKKNPELRGRGRCWFAIIFSSLFLLLWAVLSLVKVFS